MVVLQSLRWTTIALASFPGNLLLLDFCDVSPPRPNQNCLFAFLCFAPCFLVCCTRILLFCLQNSLYCLFALNKFSILFFYVCDDELLVFRRAIVIHIALCGGDLLISLLAIVIRLLLRDTDSLGCFDRPLIDG